MIVRLILLSLLVLAVSIIAEPIQWAAEDGGNGHWYEWVQIDTTW